VPLAAHLGHHHAQAALQQPCPRVGAARVVLEAEAGIDDGQREVYILGAVEHQQVGAAARRRATGGGGGGCGQCRRSRHHRRRGGPRGRHREHGADLHVGHAQHELLEVLEQGRQLALAAEPAKQLEPVAEARLGARQQRAQLAAARRRRRAAARRLAVEHAQPAHDELHRGLQRAQPARLPRSRLPRLRASGYVGEEVGEGELLPHCRRPARCAARIVHGLGGQLCHLGVLLQHLVECRALAARRTRSVRHPGQRGQPLGRRRRSARSHPEQAGREGSRGLVRRRRRRGRQRRRGRECGRGGKGRVEEVDQGAPTGRGGFGRGASTGRGGFWRGERVVGGGDGLEECHRLLQACIG
jgi:hypothetical protein